MALAVLVSALALPTAAGAQDAAGTSLHAQDLVAERTVEPLGLGVARPRLGWTLDAADRRGARQTAYRIVLDRAPGPRGGGRLWDSGLVRSSQTRDIRYGGPALTSRTAYVWRVQVRDERGGMRWSSPATIETGLLAESDWRGDWIGAPGADDAQGGIDLAGTDWIWEDRGDPLTEAPAGTVRLRRELTLPANAQGAELRRARLVVDADDGFTAWVDGTEVASTDPDPGKESWRNPQLADVTQLLRDGGATHAIAVAATNGRPSPAGMFARLVVETTGGDQIVIDSDADWTTSTAQPPDAAWTRPGFDDAGWTAARQLVAWGGAPWGEVSPQVRARPEPLLRRSFASDRVVSARLYASGLAYADLTLNGRRVSDAVLDPIFTRYDRRVTAVTHDVTKLLRRGENVLGIRLGRGFWGMRQGNAWNWDRAPWTSEPRVRAQLELTRADGRVETIATDPSWRAHDGPTRSDSLYAGEAYDARAELPGWDAPGFDDADWAAAEVLRAPAGRVESRDLEPIEIAETLRPANVTNPKPGTYVFELPRVIAGWARIHVTGEAGRTVTLRYGEKLKGDGTVQHESGFVTGESQVDRYTLAGSGPADPETWEPRYSYKGFRYVQLDGWPGAQPPTAAALDGRVVHTDLTPIGEFASSDPLLERMREVTLNTSRNNYHGIPTDTPMYEKNGWTGDGMLMAETLMLEFDLRRLLPKWVDDIADSQGPEGNLPGIAPDNGWGLGPYGQAPPWNAAFIQVPWSLYQRYGDRDVLVEHYDAMRRYVEHELTRARADGTHPSFLNDYLSPGYGGGNSPEDPALAGTAYAYRNVVMFAEIARTLGRADDAARYTAAAERIREAFNRVYLRDDAYTAANHPQYRQTSNLMALAFGLVPADREAAVEARLIAEIAAKGNHLDTGALGTRELLPELTARGHGDLAYTLVTQPTYPSFRYILDQGATSWWEGWEPTVRSYDHTFVQGTVDQWLIEWVAGIRPLAPGYARVLLSPATVGDLRSARAATVTPFGRLAVAWERRDARFTLDATVPVGVVALVDVPAARPADVRESGRPVGSAPGVREVSGAPEGHVRFEVQSGSYRFTAGR